MHLRRIVTGHDENGRSVFVDDGDPPRSHIFAHVPGMEFALAWGTAGGVRVPLDGADPTPGMASSLPDAANSTRVCFMQIPPDSGAADLDGEKAVAEQLEVLPELLAYFEPDAPGFHRTPSVDYVVLLDGELVLELDDGAEKIVHPGDIVVQNGTRHAWHNRTDSPAVFVGVLIGRPDRP